jgi:hypothetical protein
MTPPTQLRVIAVVTVLLVSAWVATMYFEFDPRFFLPKHAN